MTTFLRQIAVRCMASGRIKPFSICRRQTCEILAATAVLLLIVSLQAVSQSSLKIESVRLTGATAFDHGELHQILKAQEGEMFNRRFLKLDEILLANYYMLRGFLNVYVESNFQKEADKILIEYQIREGTRYYLQQIEVLGSEVQEAERVRRRFKIKDGDVFEPQVIESGLNANETWYLNHGKPYIVLSETRETIDDSLVHMKLYIHEGETVKIGHIRYDGREHVKAFLIRRELQIKKGDLYSRRLLESSQRNIYSTGLFKYVDYRLEPINSREDSVRLIWEVDEKEPAWIGLRFGISHEERQSAGNVVTFDVGAEGGYRNLFGTARSISLSAVPSFFYGRPEEGEARAFSNPRNQYSFTFVEPWMFSTRTPGIFRISYSQEEQPIAVYPLTILSTSFRAHHNFENFWSLSTGFSFQNIDTPDAEIRERVGQGQDLIYALFFDPIKDKRDNVYVPIWGYITEFRNKFVYSTSETPDSISAVSVIGQDTLTTTGNAVNQFYKFVPQWTRYQRFPLNREWILATRLRGGGLIEIGTHNHITRIPVTERFYLGGSSTVRGYAEQSIGNEQVFYDEEGEIIETLPVGGKVMFVANAELRIPLIWGFYGETFLDVGNIWEEFNQIDLGLKVGAGVGLAYITPFGPIRLDYGVKLTPDEGDSFGELHLGISFAY